MKNEELLKNQHGSLNEIPSSELANINGGDDGDIAYAAGYSYIFTVAHIFTFGLSTYAYLLKKAAS
ncbi:MAG: hypothetical protein K9J30_11015 [Bacteroidales bacterium]|nr:hypothetical protein [Bacteroidales bacterium]